MEIKQVLNSDEKREICRGVLQELPEWFGIPEALDNYVEQSAELPLWKAEIDGEIAGFICVRASSSSTTELYVMGVLRKYHRQGIGKILFDTCIDWCKENGYEFLQVKTLAPSHPDKGYSETRKFYQAMGFKELECIPEIWGEENPCMIMVMSIPSKM